MAVVMLIGRLLVAWLFVASGAGNVVRRGQVAAHARRRGIRDARRIVTVAGVVFATTGVALALGLWLDVVLVAAIVELLVVTWVMFPFWKVPGEEARPIAVDFWKNLALAGSMAVWLAHVVDTGDVGWAITGPLF